MPLPGHMKHILKKLHFGGGNHEPSRDEEPSASSAPAPPSPATPGLSCGSDHRRAMGTPPSPSPPSMPPQASPTAPAPEGDGGGAASAVAADDYFLTEEEFQVQLAMAISVSNTEFGEDPHNDQIRAATLLSLERHRSGAAREYDGAADSLSRRYWDYSALDYEDNIVDGFYDIFELSADPSRHGKMPSLSDLQSKVGEFGLEVIVVNRKIDRSLIELEQVAQCISLDCSSGKTDLLVERIAQLVTDNMGGPVKDANDMLAKWMERSTALRTSMQSSLTPIGAVTVGLSRHRALLFKVLVDKIGIPCKLVKGSHYTGIDGDALNIIKLEDGREYLVDLMAEPGTLIPADVLGTKDGSLACQNSQINKSPDFPGETVPGRFKVDSGDISSENGLLKKQHGEYGKLREGEIGAQQGTGKRLLTSWPSSNSSQVNGESCSAMEKKSAMPKEKSSQFLAANSTTSLDKGALDLSGHSERERSQADYHLQDNVDSTDLFSELNPFQSSGLGKAALHSKQAGKQANGFQRRRENVSPGPGRAPLPLVWKNRSACNEHSRNKSNEVADGAPPRKNIKSKDHNPSSNIASVPTSHGNMYPESSQISTSRTSGCLYSHGFDIPKNEVTDFLTGDSFGGTISNDDISFGARVNQLGPSVSTNISRVENPALLPNSSENILNEADEVHKNALITSTTYQQEHGKHVKDKSDNKKGLHDRFMGADTSMSSVAPTLARTDKFDPMFDHVAGLEIQWDDLVIGERIGLGSYGEVYHAEWNGTEVAVKKFLDQDFYGDALDEFLSEVRIMRRLRHPNVVLFMGAVTCPPNLSIVSEFLPRGSLYRILHRPNCQIDQKRRIKMALDVAKGMNCLHTSTPTIVHRDLKSPNLLVDKNWNVKVCDFGLSRLKHNTFLSSKSTAGTPEWMAPEVLRNEQSNEKCDVYSFGVIFWELATLRMPWSGMNPMQVVGAVGFQNRRLEIPNEIDPSVAGIIRECWQQEPNLRPSFAQLTASLKPLQRLTIPSQGDPPSQEIPS